jgi:ribosomal protein S7
MKKKNKKINNKILSMLHREKKIKFNLEDSKYKSLVFNRFINRMMRNGKKANINKMVTFSFKLIKRKYNKTPIKIFQHVIKKLRPYMLIKTYNVAGKPFNIPFFINSKNSIKATFG